MVRSIEKLADRFLSRFAPRLEAKADRCSCSGRGYKKAANNICTGGNETGLWRCNGCHWVFVECVHY
jgi:hypothetical protein